MDPQPSIFSHSTAAQIVAIVFLIVGVYLALADQWQAPLLTDSHNPIYNALTSGQADMSDPEDLSTVAPRVEDRPEANESVKRFAEMVLRGDDLSRVGYSYYHLGDTEALVRLYLDIGWYLLAILNDLDGLERTRAEKFLCNGGLGDPLENCSPAEIEVRLKNFEDQL